MELDLDFDLDFGLGLNNRSNRPLCHIIIKQDRQSTLSHWHKKGQTELFVTIASNRPRQSTLKYYRVSQNKISFRIFDNFMFSCLSKAL